MTATVQRPLDLPRLVMRRAAWVALGTWLLMLMLGLQRAGVDMEQEVQAARTMAELMSRLAQPLHASDDELLAQLRRTVQIDGLRHLALGVHDADGTVLFATAADEPPEEPPGTSLAFDPWRCHGLTTGP